MSGPIVPAAALALVLSSTTAAVPAEPRQLSPGERELYRLAVEWSEQAQLERARRQAAERKLADLAAEPPDVCDPCPEPVVEVAGWSTLEVVGVGAIVAVVAGAVGLVVGAGVSK